MRAFALSYGQECHVKYNEELTMDEVFEELDMSNEGTLEGLTKELGKLRTGRANLGMLEGVRVDYYGQSVPLNQVASMKVADARLITIQPWEKPMVGAIEKAIMSSDLGFNPSNDGTLVRVPVPALTGERRKDLVKLSKRIGEDHRVSLRNARRDANDAIKHLEKEGQITEDEMHRALARINDITNEFTKKVDAVLSAKEQEILEV